jgi:hypothetical protein
MTMKKMMRIIINESQLKRVILEDSKSTTQEFITKAENIHGDRYDYDKVDYKTARLPVIITCPIHGDFIQRPNDHLSGKGCPKCGRTQKSTTQEFIDKSKKVHGDKYDYDKVDYKNSQSPIVITCPIHGDFSQRPNDHLNGKGCPKCSESKGEKSINEVLKKYNINYTQNKKFEDCIGFPDKKGFCYELKYDFFLPDKNIIIEFDGEQHFKPIKIMGGVSDFNRNKKYDKIKNDYCEKNGIRLIRIPWSINHQNHEYSQKYYDNFVSYVKNNNKNYISNSKLYIEPYLKHILNIE